jgi:hypothetical protein
MARPLCDTPLVYLFIYLFTYYLFLFPSDLGQWELEAPFVSKRKWRKKKSIKEDELNSKTNNAKFVMYSAVPKKVMHILESKFIFLEYNSVLACTLLTRNFENTIFSTAKDELQVAVGLLRAMLFNGYPIMHTCVCVCVCVCAHMCANKGAQFVPAIHVFWFIHCVKYDVFCQYKIQVSKYMTIMPW